MCWELILLAIVENVFQNTRYATTSLIVLIILVKTTARQLYSTKWMLKVGILKFALNLHLTLYSDQPPEVIGQVNPLWTSIEIFTIDYVDTTIKMEVGHIV